MSSSISVYWKFTLSFLFVNIILVKFNILRLVWARNPVNAVVVLIHADRMLPMNWKFEVCCLADDSDSRPVRHRRRFESRWSFIQKNPSPILKNPETQRRKKGRSNQFKSPDIPFCSRISRFDGAEFIGDNRRNKQFNRFESGEAGVNPAQWRYGDRFYPEVRLPDGLWTEMLLRTKGVMTWELVFSFHVSLFEHGFFIFGKERQDGNRRSTGRVAEVIAERLSGSAVFRPVLPRLSVSLSVLL